MLFFTGSDWCGWCIRLQKEVFFKPEFKKWANKNVVLVELDFPKRTKLDEKTLRQNRKLACNECSQCIKEAAQAPPQKKYLFKNCADQSTPYGYEGSDLKNLYFTRQALQSRLKAPIMTQEQLLLMRASKCSLGDANSAGPMKSCSSNKFD